MLNKNVLVTLLIVGMFTFGCQEDNPVSTEDNISEKLVEKIISDSSSVRIFSYSNKNLMKYEVIENDETTLSVTFSYSNDSKIESEELFKTYGVWNNRLYKYYYDDEDRVSKIELSYKDTNQTYKELGYFIYSYNSQQQLIESEFTFLNNTPKQTTHYLYDSNGNVIEITRYLSEGEIFDKVMYEYDNKINPLVVLHTSVFHGPIIHKNNIIRQTKESRLQPYHSETITDYIYDNDGYPLERELKYTDSQNSSYQKIEEYEYQ